MRDSVSAISLGEGNTPLVMSRRIGPALGLRQLYFKLENTNPTGSYKDRFASAAVSQMVSTGKKACIATSSGNTGSAVAAYCAAAGIPCEIALVETTPPGKLKQMLAYGAKLFRVRGFGLDPEITHQTFDHIRRLGDHPDRALQISAYCYSPVGMTGVQSLSTEIARQTNGTVHHVFSPAGGGGLTLAVARGFKQPLTEDLLQDSPAVHCVQPEGNDTIAGPLRDGAEQAQAVDCTTSVSGLQVPNVLDGDDVIRACRASGGTGHRVQDDHVFASQRRLACEEGIFCEPAAAVALAGAVNAVQDGTVDPSSTIVCLVTGAGFKDPASVDRMIEGTDVPTIEPDTLFKRM